ncbi:MFS transporter [Alkalihalobacterium elongatum]|uniref:MFS transporter n=1 Tax=Alkalihalobacterium elongatum TaxID=2675466 RepID=UPI001C1F661F|nr:MFS transporter [Alkalihalobacterium elongatum]
MRTISEVESETKGTHLHLTKTDKKKLISVLSVLLLFSVLNGTMFIVSIPDITLHFNLLPSHGSWIVTGYIIFFAIGAVLYGKLSDIYPIKTILLIGVSLFALGSLLGFFSINYAMVIIARMLQACGASAIPAVVLIIPTRYFPNERGRMLSIFSTMMVIGSGIGPVMGGVIAGFLNWQYIFLFSSFSLFTLPLLKSLLPNEEKKDGRTDIPGAILIALGVGLFITFITTFNWYFFFLSAVILGFFIWWIFHTEFPLILPSMFKNKLFRVAIIVSFLGMIIMFSNMFITPLLLREVYGLTTILIGLVMFPGALFSALTARFAGIWTDRWGSERVCFFALILIFISAILLSSFISISPWFISFAFIFAYIAFPFFQTAIASLISCVLPENQIGIGMGIFNLFNFMSSAIGAAIIGKILDYSTIGVSINPFVKETGEVATYSNIFIGMGFLVVLNGLFFYLATRKKYPKLSKH